MFPLFVYVTSGNVIVDLFFYHFSVSGNVTYYYNPAIMGNSELLHKRSDGTITVRTSGDSLYTQA
jgi:hypothetical protein